jgi:hypothetical protein
MNRRTTPEEALWVMAAALLSIVAAPAALAQPIPGKELHLTNTRNLPF